MRSFALGDILSITTERLVSRDHIDGVYRILNYMTGDELYTHQLPRASRECRPSLLAQHPWLEDINATLPEHFRDHEHVWVWLSEQEDLYGPFHDVEPLEPGDHTNIDPISELKMMRPDMPIISFDPESGEIDEH